MRHCARAGFALCVLTEVYFAKVHWQAAVPGLTLPPSGGSCWLLPCAQPDAPIDALPFDSADEASVEGWAGAVLGVLLYAMALGHTFVLLNSTHRGAPTLTISQTYPWKSPCPGLR